MNKWVIISVVLLTNPFLILGMRHNEINVKVNFYYFDDYKVPLELAICDDGKYILFYTSGEEHPDIEIVYLLSAGYIETYKDQIVLVDKENNSRIVLVKTAKDDYYVKSGFRSLLTKEFKFKKSSYDPSFLAIFETYCHPSGFDNKNSIKDHDENYQLKTGKYKDGFGDFCLILKSNHEYSFRIESFLISTGTWRREKGILLLNDTILNHSFTINIQNSCLIAGFNLPGGIFDLKLNYQNKQIKQ